MNSATAWMGKSCSFEDFLFLATNNLNWSVFDTKCIRLILCFQPVVAISKNAPHNKSFSLYFGRMTFTFSHHTTSTMSVQFQFAMFVTCIAHKTKRFPNEDLDKLNSWTILLNIAIVFPYGCQGLQRVTSGVSTLECRRFLHYVSIIVPAWFSQTPTRQWARRSSIPLVSNCSPRCWILELAHLFIVPMQWPWLQVERLPNTWSAGTKRKNLFSANRRCIVVVFVVRFSHQNISQASTSWWRVRFCHFSEPTLLSLCYWMFECVQCSSQKMYLPFNAPTRHWYLLDPSHPSQRHSTAITMSQASDTYRSRTWLEILMGDGSGVPLRRVWWVK